MNVNDNKRDSASTLESSVSSADSDLSAIKIKSPKQFGKELPKIAIILDTQKDTCDTGSSRPDTPLTPHKRGICVNRTKSARNESSVNRPSSTRPLSCVSVFKSSLYETSQGEDHLAIYDCPEEDTSESDLIVVVDPLPELKEEEEEEEKHSSNDSENINSVPDAQTLVQTDSGNVIENSSYLTKQDSEDIEESSTSESDLFKSVQFLHKENTYDDLGLIEIFNINRLNELSDRENFKEKLLTARQKSTEDVPENHLLDIFIEPLDNDLNNSFCFSTTSLTPSNLDLQSERTKAYLKKRQSTYFENSNNSEGSDYYSTNNRLVDIIFEPIKSKDSQKLSSSIGE